MDFYSGAGLHPPRQAGRAVFGIPSHALAELITHPQAVIQIGANYTHSILKMKNSSYTGQVELENFRLFQVLFHNADNEF